MPSPPALASSNPTELGSMAPRVSTLMPFDGAGDGETGVTDTGIGDTVDGSFLGSCAGKAFEALAAPEAPSGFGGARFSGGKIFA